RGLAATRFTDEAERFARADREADPIYRQDMPHGAAQDSLLYREVLLQPADFEDRVSHAPPLPRPLARRASTQQRVRGAFPRIAELLAGRYRSRAGSAAQTCSPAAGCSAPAPSPGSPA